jgi:hypothetical protein
MCLVDAIESPRPAPNGAGWDRLRSSVSACGSQLRYGEVRSLLLEGQRDGTWQARGEAWPAFCFD